MLLSSDYVPLIETRICHLGLVGDLDCLDQYNSCSCEVVVLEPIEDLEAMWEALETDRKALWQSIEELIGFDVERAFLPKTQGV